MLIYVFPPHYQLVYINFDISSFSLISYKGVQPWILLCSTANTTVFLPSTHTSRGDGPEGYARYHTYATR